MIEFVAFRAKNIKNRPEVNQKMSKREVIKEYNQEITQLRSQLDVRSPCGPIWEEEE